MLEEIYALALTFLGGAGEDTALRAACKAAEAELGAKLKPGISPEDCSDSFVCAAAWLALAGYGAAETGIRPDDVLLRADGQALGSIDDLMAVRRTHLVGDTITLTVLRDGQTFDVDVPLYASAD